MKRTGQLKRSRISRGSSKLRRTRLKQVGKRAEREREALAAFRANPPKNCERCNRYCDRLHAHHIKPRSRGGTHTADNRAWLCFGCHLRVHDHSAEDWRRFVA